MNERYLIPYRIARLAEISVQLTLAGIENELILDGPGGMPLLAPKGAYERVHGSKA